jgi:FlaA1/EpsC-like NDP-sugar epimerase
MIEKSEKLTEVESYKTRYKYINKFTRGLFFIVGDIICLMLSAMAAFVILAPFASEGRAFPFINSLLLIGSALAGLAIFRMYVVNWRYTGLRELVRLVCGITLGGLISLSFTEMLLSPANYEYAYIALFMMNGVLFIGGFRISKRIFIELVNSPNKKKSRKHTIIFGGESEGEQIVRDILKNDHWNLAIYGIFDDRVMPGLLLHGIRIKGGRKKMIEYIRLNPVDQLIVAFPEIPKKELKQIIDKVKEIRPNMDIKVLPSFHSLTDDPVGVKNIRDISIEDILGREPVSIDMASIKASIKGKTVLVTGAGGSIGSELVRQCANLKPKLWLHLILMKPSCFILRMSLKIQNLKLSHAWQV